MKRVLAAIPLLFCICCSSIMAQPVEEILVKAPNQANHKSPVTYHNINREDLQLYPALQEPAFLLSQTPSVSTYSDSGSYQGYAYFRLRGMDQTRINMTLDGIPLNEPEDQGVYFSNYPGVFGALDQVQIQRGVGISQHGTASYAGSVQLSSVDVFASPYTAFTGSYGSFSTQSGSLETLTALDEQTAFYINVSGVKSDGYKYDSGNQSYSIFTSAARRDDHGLWKWLAFSGKQDNELAWLGVEKNAATADRRHNANRNEHDDFRQTLISLARDQILSQAFSLETRAYYNTLKGGYDFDFNNFLGLEENGELYRYDVESDFTGLFSTLHYQTENLNLSGGFHINRYSRDHVGSEQTLGELYRNTGYKNSETYFIKTTYRSNKWLYFADLEHRSTHFDYRGSVDFDDIRWSFTNPRLGISFLPTENLTLYYSIGKTRREPTRTDIFGGMDNLEVDENGNPLLFVVNPEAVVNHEVGLRFGNEDRELSVNVFHMRFNDEITLNGQFGPNGLVLNQDVENSVREGIELTTDVLLNQTVQWTSSLSFINSKIEDEGEAFNPVLTPRWMAHSRLCFCQGTLEYGIEARYQSQSYLDLANTETLDGFFVVNTFLRHQWKNIQTTLYLNNLLDREYFSSGNINGQGEAAYFTGAPLNALISVKVAI